ncbi:hypothetical protein TIFTF001_032956 [Ficus carica]|uniref:Uncharacterized protein n=1 Tax=Ficus carica TaxID=3494 RepID=A0AA88DXL8_FICCA|nr:hypothetical protein TIFTF001_032956 [Ficus carica]
MVPKRWKPTGLEEMMEWTVGMHLFATEMLYWQWFTCPFCLDMAAVKWPPILAIKRARATRASLLEAAKGVVVARTIEATRALIRPPFPLIDSSLEPLNVLKQPPAKKQKAGEKPAKKALVNDGQIQDHLNKFSWDGLKCILRGMRIIYVSTDKAIERKERIRELEDTNKERVKKLLDIEPEMMRSMVDRFDKAKAENDALRESIKQKDGDIEGHVAHIMGK